MQLHSVHIENYKNLHDFHVDLSGTNGVAVIVGPNGSGKSNILEALALIFAEIMGFVHNHNQIDHNQIDRYKISYEIDGVIYNATKSNGKLEVKDPQGEDAIKGPDGIIGAYCGEFNRLFDVGFKDLTHAGYQSGMLPFSSDDYELVTLCAFLTRKGQADTIKGSSLALVCRPVRISFLIINEEMGWSDSSESVAEEILRRLASAKRNRDGRIEMPFSRFQRVFSDVISGWRLLDGADIYIIISQLLTQSEYAPFIGAIDLILENERGEEFSFSDLSEGEKHLMMYKVLYENIVNSSMLVLLDEPDAYLHENWKQNVFERIRYWGAKGRMTIFSTHSPILIDTIPSEHIFFFHHGKNGIEVVPGAKLNAVVELTSGRMSTFRMEPIVLFEGVYDVEYVKRAYASLRRRFPEKYPMNSIDEICDMVPCGGASNIPVIYRKYRDAFPMRPIVVFYDHDDGKEDLMPLAYQLDIDRATAKEESVWEENFVFALPKPKTLKGREGPRYLNWAIEDYFSKKFLNHVITTKYLQDNSYASYKTLTAIRDVLKPALGKGAIHIPDKEWSRFAPLINKIIHACAHASVRPYRHLPVISVVAPIFDLTENTLNRIDSLMCQDYKDFEVFICGVGIDVCRDAMPRTKYSNDCRITFLQHRVPDVSCLASSVKDADVNGRYRIDSNGLKQMDTDFLSRWFANFDGNEQVADGILREGFLDPKVRFVERTKRKKKCV